MKSILILGFTLCVISSHLRDLFLLWNLVVMNVNALKKIHYSYFCNYQEDFYLEVLFLQASNERITENESKTPQSNYIC